MRNYANEYAWEKEKYARLTGKLDKQLITNFKEVLKNKNISFNKWLEQKIKEELNTIDQ